MSHGISPSCNISTIIMGINWAGDQQVTKDKLITFVHWNLSTSSAALSSSVIKKPPSSYDLLLVNRITPRGFLSPSPPHPLHLFPSLSFAPSISFFTLFISLFYLSSIFSSLVLSHSISFRLSLSLPFSLPLYFSFSSLSLSPPIAFFLLSLPLYFPPSISPLSLSLCLSLYLSLPLFLPSLSLSLCLSLYLSLPLFLLSPPLSHYVYPCISPSLLPNPSLSPYPLYLPLSFPPPSLSLSLFLSLSFSLVLDFLLPSCVNIMHCLREWKFNTVNLFSTISAVCIV